MCVRACDYLHLIMIPKNNIRQVKCDKYTPGFGEKKLLTMCLVRIKKLIPDLRGSCLSNIIIDPDPLTNTVVRVQERTLQPHRSLLGTILS